MVKKLTPGQKRALIASLSSKRVRNVSYRGGYISLVFDGKRLRNRVVVRHDPGVADWSRSRNEVHHDESLKKIDILPILVHETVEKYVTQKYGLRVNLESHGIAQRVESRFVQDECSKKYKKFCTHTGRCWRLHESRIRRVWEKEGRVKRYRPA